MGRKSSLQPETRTQETEEIEKKIVIDLQRGLVFSSEKEVFNHFSRDIRKLSDDLMSRRSSEDVPVDRIHEFVDLFQKTLSQPDEVWEDDQRVEGESVAIYVARFERQEFARGVSYVAVAYMTDGEPSFVYLHFPTIDESLAKSYCKGRLVFTRVKDVHDISEVEGDALSEGEDLAVGLYKAMLAIRGESDIPESRFNEFIKFREDTIDHPSEIWRYSDSDGNMIVTFIKEYSGGEESLWYYVAITVEEAASESQYLLFSFPTIDVHLVDRYRRGESLSLDNFVREESH